MTFIKIYINGNEAHYFTVLFDIDSQNIGLLVIVYNNIIKITISIQSSLLIVLCYGKKLL